MNTNTALYQVSTIYAYFSNKSHHFVYLIIMIGLLGVMHYTIKKRKSQLRQMSDFCYQFIVMKALEIHRGSAPTSQNGSDPALRRDEWREGLPRAPDSVGCDSAVPM